MFKKLHLPHRHKSNDSVTSHQIRHGPLSHSVAGPSDESIASPEGRKLSADSNSEWQRRHSSASNVTLVDDHRPSLPARLSSQPGSESSLALNSDSFGLHIVHDPHVEPALDIIFLHGLGGGCRRTWSWDRNPDYFWPGLWLPYDQDVNGCRIFSYGYNANFKGGPRSISTVTDFAKALLFDLSFGRDNLGRELGIGKSPILFIAHSMGGLVVKKAFLLGQYDDTYRDLVLSMQGVIFLSTPHRGTQLADTLQKILTVTFRSSKDYLSDLSASSHTLEDLNEQFRHVGQRLSIVSFYETLATEIGFSKIMVLDRESSVLGYSGEISTSLDADHHNVCKFQNPTDANYLKVLSAIKTLISRLGRNQSVQNHAPVEAGSDNEDSHVDMKERLRVTSGPERDLSDNLGKWASGTCAWFLAEPPILTWLDEPSGQHVIWYTAPPGSGKSVLASHMIQHLSRNSVACQYFFFRAGDQTKRSIADMLRSIAYQAAATFTDFRKKLARVLSTGIAVEKGDALMVWRTLFQDLLLETPLDQPLYWVLDALDECDSPKALFELLRTLPPSKSSLRILVTSRRIESLTRTYRRLPRGFKADSIDKEGDDHNLNDIRIYAEAELEHLQGSEDMKQKVLDSVLSRAGGNFLWVKLVLEELQFCHTESDIVETLDEIPEDMNDLYARMEETLVANSRGDFRLSKYLLQWTICAPRSMTLSELNHALAQDYPGILDLKRTVRETCGQFILVDQGDRVIMLHKTARDYLIHSSTSALAVDRPEAHTKLLIRSLAVMNDQKLRSELTQKQQALVRTKPFTIYAAETWALHLRSVEATSDTALDALMAFFEQNAVLSWIHLLTLTGRLDIVVKTAKNIGSFISKFRKGNTTRNPMLHRLSDLEHLELWSTDLIRVVGKFNRQLRTNPLSLYKVIPALCPESSPLHKQFYRAGVADITISAPEQSWNDNLARFALPNEEQPWKVACAGLYIAVVALGGIVHVWTAFDFTEVCTLRHTENVTAMCMDSNGEKLAVYGLLTTCVWSLPTGTPMCTISNPPSSRAITLVFAGDAKTLLSGCGDRSVRYLELDGLEKGWQGFDERLLRERDEGAGTFVNSPKWIEFSPDGSQIGVSYRGFPLSVWSLDNSRLVSRCWRANDVSQRGKATTNWAAVDQFTWNPTSGHIVGLYKDGCIFKWHPSDNNYQEVKSVADEVACSRDGRLFATSNTQGTIKVWNFNYFSPIYQLASEDLVGGLTFSPDGSRIYDIRGIMVNVWEPNGLLRFAEAEEHSSDVASDVLSDEHQSTSMSTISEATVLEFEPISALALAPTQDLCAIGNEVGSISMLDLSTGDVAAVASFHNFMGISHFNWSSDGHFLATADLGGDAMILEIGQRAVNGGKRRLVRELQRPKLHLEGRTIHQMFFSPDASGLLIVCDCELRLWNVASSATSMIKSVEHATSRSWSTTPNDSKHLIGVGPHDVVTFSWLSLDMTACLRLVTSRGRRSNSISMRSGISERAQLSASSRSPTSNDISSLARQSSLSSDGRYMLFQVLKSSFWGQISRRPLILQTDSLSVSNDLNPQRLISSLVVPEVVIRQILTPLGISNDNKLMFLDQDLWLCSCSIMPNLHQPAITRHYFIPRDWSGTEGLQHCCLLRDGTLLAPRNGAVVVIKSKFGNLEF